MKEDTTQPKAKQSSQQELHWTKPGRRPLFLILARYSLPSRLSKTECTCISHSCWTITDRAVVHIWASSLEMPAGKEIQAPFLHHHHGEFMECGWQTTDGMNSLTTRGRSGGSGRQVRSWPNGHLARPWRSVRPLLVLPTPSISLISFILS